MRLLSILLAFFLTLSISAQGIQHVDAKTFMALIQKGDGVLLDVRTAGEYSRGHIENSTLISTSDREFVKKVKLLQKDKPLYVYCLTGSRSRAVVEYLHKQGYTQLYNLFHGIMDWQRQGYQLVQGATVVPSDAKSYSLKEFSDVLQASGLTLVDFHAPWCAPCKKMLPIVDGLASDYANKVSVLKLDIQANEKLKKQYNIASIPGLVLFKGEQEVWRHTGMITKEDLYKVVEGHL